MARNKYPEQTIQRILDVSFHLFSTKGYEKTSIQDIVNNLGMSKGAIYHHFKSKEEILQRLCDGTYSDLGWLQEIQNAPMSGLKKLHALLLYQLGDQKKLSMDRITITMMSEPHILVESMKTAVADVAPLIAALIEEGRRDGSITTQYPLEAAEVLLILANAWISPLLYPVDRERYVKKIRFYQALFAGIGVPMMDEELVQAAANYYDVMLGEAENSTKTE